MFPPFLQTKAGQTKLIRVTTSCASENHELDMLIIYSSHFSLSICCQPTASRLLDNKWPQMTDRWLTVDHARSSLQKMLRKPDKIAGRERGNLQYNGLAFCCYTDVRFPPEARKQETSARRLHCTFHAGRDLKANYYYNTPSSLYLPTLRVSHSCGQKTSITRIQDNFTRLTHNSGLIVH